MICGAAPGLRRNHGFTLAELLVVLFITAVLLSLAVVRINVASDRAAIHAALGDASAVMTSARTAAIYRREPVAIAIDTIDGAITAYAGGVVLFRRELRSAYHVRLTVSRDSMAFDAHGLGIGAANLSIAVRRGAAAETLFVSRLGRVRY